MGTATTGEPRVGAAERPGRWLLLALGSAVLVIGAVVLEIVSGLYANSPVPAWADRVVPISWPRAGRVLWWLAVGGAAAGYRVGLHRAGIPQRRAVTVATVVPFVVFAFGVAVGADWATWH